MARRHVRTRPPLATFRLPVEGDGSGIQVASLSPGIRPKTDADFDLNRRQMNRPNIPGRFHMQLLDWMMERGMGINSMPPLDPNIPHPRSGPEVPKESEQERRRRLMDRYKRDTEELDGNPDTILMIQRRNNEGRSLTGLTPQIRAAFS